MAGEPQNSCSSALKPRKATWTPEIHKIFVDLCLEQTLNGYKPGTYITKEGWKIILESFQKKSGLMYDKKQLKNHWDNAKEQWKAWRKLTSTSSMGWDPKTGRFDASEEDWANYTEENPEAAQFRFKELLCADQLDTIFDGTAIIGETEPPTRRRKHNHGSTPTATPMPTPLSTRPESRSEHLFDAVESRSTVTVHSSLGKLTYSIGECIDCLDGMEEIEQGSDLYLFALDIFLKDYREIFLNLKRSSVRTAWLKRLQSAGNINC